MTHRHRFPVHPVADAASIVGGEGCKYRFTILTDGLLRYEWAPDCVFEDRASTLAINRHLTVPEFRAYDSHEGLEIVTQRFHVRYDKERFSASGFTVTVPGHSRHGNPWRFGEEANGLGGTARTLDAMEGEPDGRTALGGGVISRSGYANIDDSKSMLFDGQGWIGSRKPGDRVDGYMFAYAHDYRAAIKAFYAFSGNQPLLPRWSLGNWWSRFYPYSSESYLKLMEKFHSERIPLSVGVIDMDWHLRKQSQVTSSGWTGYTWDESLFPDPAAFLGELHKRQLRVTLNDHPAEGVHSFEEPFQDMARALGRDPSHGLPIPFDIATRDFLDAFFDVLHRRFEKQGIDFWWIDWQQGVTSRLPGVDPLWMLNHFHFVDNALGGRRPLIFSRYAGPGSHRYPVGFSGDTHITWATLDFQPEFTATASNIGYGWWSHDIGGHYHGSHDEELTTRWVQLGVFSPIMRLHSSEKPFLRKEPWLFGVEPRSVISCFLRLRHRLLPYLYTMNVRSARDAEPIVQPMYWSHTEKQDAYSVRNQYFFGSELVVVPITAPSDVQTRLGRVKAWIPPDRHIDIFSGVVYDGDRKLWLYRPLDQYPVLAKEGAIIPLDADFEPPNGSRNPPRFEVIIIVGADGNFDILEDDDTGADLDGIAFTTTSINYEQANGTIRIKHTPSTKLLDLPETREWTLRFPAYRVPEDVRLTLDGRQSNATIESDEVSGGSIVRLGPIACSTEVCVEIGANPNLRPTDFRKHLESVIDRAHVDFELKIWIWDIVKAENPLSVKIGQLAALGMDEVVQNALFEYLVADHRSNT